MRNLDGLVHDLPCFENAFASEVAGQAHGVVHLTDARILKFVNDLRLNEPRFSSLKTLS